MTAPNGNLGVDPQLRQALIDIQLHLARDSRQEQQDLARRRVARLTSALGGVASLLALYDLSLFARIGH